MRMAGKSKREGVKADLYCSEVELDFCAPVENAAGTQVAEEENVSFGIHLPAVRRCSMGISLTDLDSHVGSNGWVAFSDT